jgi:hypothetical protein
VIELLRNMASLRMCRQLSRSLTSASASASSLFSRGNVASDDLIVWIRLHVVWL